MANPPDSSSSTPSETDSRTCTIEYHHLRLFGGAASYRLWRRTAEIIRCIRNYSGPDIRRLIDLGCADGLMLSAVKSAFPRLDCVGLEYTRELLMASEDERLSLIQGDVRSIPAGSGLFDVAVGAAVIEHLPDPLGFLSEARRVLRPEGVLILTCPDPFWEAVARRLGHLPAEGHCNVLGLDELESMLRKMDFQVVARDRFMISPVGIPFEVQVERFLKGVGLARMLANQIVVARKGGRRDTE